MTQELRQEAIEAILTAKDLCGDEFRALRQVEDDHGVFFNASETSSIMFEVGRRWEESQKACGAKVLTDSQRRSAEKALND